MYRMSGFADKLKISGKLCTLNERNIWFCGEIEYPKFHQFSGKFCILYMYGMARFAEKLNILKYINSTGNYLHYTYGMSGFADKLKIQNYVSSMRNCVHSLYGLSGFADIFKI